MNIDRIVIAPWTAYDLHGDHGLRSVYVETFWLPVLGPSCVCLLRLAGAAFEADMTIGLPIGALAQAVGLGVGAGAHSPVRRTIDRLCTFNVAALFDDGTLLVRRRLPTLNPRQLRRLPEWLHGHHDTKAVLA